MDRGLTVLCAAQLHENQLERHLELFELLPEVSKVILVRHEALPQRLSKLDQRIFSSGKLPRRAWGMLRTVDEILAREHVDWVVGFNPVPWGSLAWLPAKRRGTKVCLSLIGRDFHQIGAWWGRPFLAAVLGADAVTVTGKQMAEGLVALGVARAKITILPHSVDTERFVPSTLPAGWDVIAIGQLIQRKRMDVLIDAVGILASRGLPLRLAIAGRGPLEADLRRRARERNVSDLVEFLGYRDDVESLLARARSFCLASEWEGVPFALMEALAAGLVPVVTNVGTIGDWIDHGKNGLLLRPGSVEDLVSAWAELFRPGGGKLDELRANVLSGRERLALAVGARVWRTIFSGPNV